MATPPEISISHYPFGAAFWGQRADWWQKAMLINARRETAASGRMFKPLWQHGRAVVPANGLFEWDRTNDLKQPYFIYHRLQQPLFFAAIGKRPLVSIMAMRDLSS